jgi:hypothetical protein
MAPDLTRLDPACTGKVPYSNRGEAMARIQAQRIRKSPIGHMQAYRCAACGKWHVGSGGR